MLANIFVTEFGGVQIKLFYLYLSILMMKLHRKKQPETVQYMNAFTYSASKTSVYLQNLCFTGKIISQTGSI